MRNLGLTMLLPLHDPSFPLLMTGRFSSHDAGLACALTSWPKIPQAAGSQDIVLLGHTDYFDFICSKKII